MAHMPTVTVIRDKARRFWYLYVLYVVDNTHGWVVGEDEDEYPRDAGEWKSSYLTNENYSTRPAPSDSAGPSA